MLKIKHPKIQKALEKYGISKFENDAKELLNKYSRCRIVLGLLGGPSTGRYNFCATAGKAYPRPAVRYVKNIGIVGISRHSGSYLYISL